MTGHLATLELTPLHLLPADTLSSSFFVVLAGFVAVNTVMYAALALSKVLPKVYLADLYTSANRRAESRSIYPPGHPTHEGTPRPPR